MANCSLRPRGREEAHWLRGSGDVAVLLETRKPVLLLPNHLSDIGSRVASARGGLRLALGRRLSRRRCLCLGVLSQQVADVHPAILFRQPYVRAVARSAVLQQTGDHGNFAKIDGEAQWRASAAVPSFQIGAEADEQLGHLRVLIAHGEVHGRGPVASQKAGSTLHLFGSFFAIGSIDICTASEEEPSDARVASFHGKVHGSHPLSPNSFDLCSLVQEAFHDSLMAAARGKVQGAALEASPRGHRRGQGHCSLTKG
mmetsp:Transcript_13867/g.51773  ORF Transcript_13867/g.51773 Transcript_13867/m.51773 type:complete len:256 (-) Transcript_13867:840-1607(-)